MENVLKEVEEIHRKIYYIVVTEENQINKNPKRQQLNAIMSNKHICISDFVSF